MISAVSVRSGMLSGMMYYQGMIRCFLEHKEQFSSSKWFGSSSGAVVGVQFVWLSQQDQPMAIHECQVEQIKLLLAASDLTGLDYWSLLTILIPPVSDEFVQEHIRNRCHVNISRWSNFRMNEWLVSDWSSRKDLMFGLFASGHIPFVPRIVRFSWHFYNVVKNIQCGESFAPTTVQQAHGVTKQAKRAEQVDQKKSTSINDFRTDAQNIKPSHLSGARHLVTGIDRVLPFWKSSEFRNDGVMCTFRSNLCVDGAATNHFPVPDDSSLHKNLVRVSCRHYDLHATIRPDKSVELDHEFTRIVLRQPFALPASAVDKIMQQGYLDAKQWLSRNAQSFVADSLKMEPE